MNKIPESIDKNPELKPAEDYYRLRREGIGFIEKIASNQWTDYNAHDPGITILEILCYAITDLAYRANWDIKDLLTHEKSATDSNQAFPNQAFFTAREILTVNPVTPDDFRRLLCDLDGVRNAWLFCHHCPCDVGYYADYQTGQFCLSYQTPILQTATETTKTTIPEKIALNGLYEILLELEADSKLGDLNDHKIEHRYTVFDTNDKPHNVMLEMRFSNTGLATHKLFNQKEIHIKINHAEIAIDKTYQPLTIADLRNHWRHVFFVRFTIELTSKETIIEHAAMRIFGDITAKNAETALDDMQQAIQNANFIQLYHQKLSKKNAVVKKAKQQLHAHRNLDEDFCRVNIVNIEDIAVCADIEVMPNADIERVQAQIWFEIENYLNPAVRFYSLQELLSNDTAVENIFNGPKLNHGFIKDEELQAAELKTVLRTSDIINRLVDIDGVVAVNNLLLSKYDNEGRLVKGQADPTTTGFESHKISAAWVLYIQEKHQPRLCHNLSRFLFFKNGLPFMPRMDEARQTLIELRGEAERPKIKNAETDLTIPSGIFRHPEDYYPVQYSFPLTYGIGTEGLPSGASSERKAQAKQLKAYLMVFEQLLANALAQLAHAEQLFSLDSALSRTYFAKELSKIIQGYDKLLKTDVLNQTQLDLITETKPEFYQRRNRFLNHLMARFGEQFNEYTLLLTNFLGHQVALDRLIDDKIAFLQAYPLISSDRSKAFNYQENPTAPNNFSGLKQRVSLLLGYPELIFSDYLAGDTYEQHKVKFPLNDHKGNTWLVAKKDTAQGFQDIMAQMVRLNAYSIIKQTNQFHLKLKQKNSDKSYFFHHPTAFKTKAEAEAFRDELIGWSASRRTIIVEHLLLRPKFPGDALYPVHTDNCNAYTDSDPYSCRLTFIMPGWTTPYNVNMDMRRFAERTIRQETPAHLLVKICWVDNIGFDANPCEPLLTILAELLQKDALSDKDKACKCANTIFKAYTLIFESWFDAHKTNPWLKNTWEAKIAELFKNTQKTDFNCAKSVSKDTWDKIQTTLLAYFTDIALHGWQFERFEAAWCQWLDANAKIDWTEVRLQEQVLAVLKAGLDTTQPTPTEKSICDCAAKIIGAYAEQFYAEMQKTIADPKGLTWKDFKLPELEIKSFSSLSLSDETKTKQTLTELLTGEKGLYKDWIKVSFRLWKVVNLLSELRNTYPNATLHDCDDGSDQNPVRLGSTALGSYPLRSST